MSIITPAMLSFRFDISVLHAQSFRSSSFALSDPFVSVYTWLNFHGLEIANVIEVKARSLNKTRATDV